MEGSVMWWNGACTLPHVVSRANGHRRKRETQGPVSEPMLVELRLQELGSRR